MAKSFTGGIDSLLGDKPNQQDRPKRGRPVTQNKEVTKTTQLGTLQGETRATFIVKEDLLEKLKFMAYWERTLIKEVVNKAFQEAVDRYEKTNGPIETQKEAQK